MFDCQPARRNVARARFASSHAYVTTIQRRDTRGQTGGGKCYKYRLVHIVCRCRGILNGYPLYSFQRFSVLRNRPRSLCLFPSPTHTYTHTQHDTLSCSAAIESRATCCWPIACNPACTRTWKNHVLKAATGTTSRRNSLADYRSIDRWSCSPMMMPVKFSDGTTDWTKTCHVFRRLADRSSSTRIFLKYQVSKFNCSSQIAFFSSPPL